MKRELGRLEDTFCIPGSNPKPTFFAHAECNALLHIAQSTISPKGWSWHIWHFSSSDSSSHCKLNSPRVLQAQALRKDKEPLPTNRGITSSILSHFNDAIRNVI